MSIIFDIIFVYRAALFFVIATYKKAALSDAAKMHKFRNVRSPSKCKECDSYVYFNGAECERVIHFMYILIFMNHKKRNLGISTINATNYFAMITEIKFHSVYE